MPRKRSLGQYVSNKRLKTLLRDSQWAIDEELSVMLQPYTAYRHSDGRILWSGGGIGRLFELDESQEYLAFLRSTREHPGPHHVLKDRLPQGRDFPEQVPTLIAQLPVLLNLPSQELDFSRDSLVKIEKKLRRKGFDICLEPPIFPALVAYLGEIMRRQISGTWRMRLEEDGQTWSPWIVDVEGRVCQPWLDLYDDLYEGPLSIGNIPYMRVASRRLPALVQNQRSKVECIEKRLRLEVSTQTASQDG